MNIYIKTSKILYGFNLIIAISLCGCGGGRSNYDKDAPQSISLSKSPILLNSGATFGENYWEIDKNIVVKPINDVQCLTNENYHIHTHLSIFLNGKALTIPKNIGLSKSCALELHTHDEAGIIHVETSIYKKFNLGQFFSVWGKNLGGNSVADINSTEIKYYIVDDGKLTEFSGDPLSIELIAHRSINIIIGKPPKEIPNFAWPSDL